MPSSRAVHNNKNKKQEQTNKQGHHIHIRKYRYYDFDSSLNMSRNVGKAKIRILNFSGHTDWYQYSESCKDPMCYGKYEIGSLQWRHNERNAVSNHQPHNCLPNRLFRHRLKKPSKLRVIGLCEGNSPVTGEFPAQRTSNAENVSIWWRHHDFQCQWIPFQIKMQVHYLE